MKMEPLEFILANDLGYVEGAIIKYVARWRFKNGIEDLEKARHYLDVLIEDELKRQNPLVKVQQETLAGDPHRHQHYVLNPDGTETLLYDGASDCCPACDDLELVDS